MRQRNRDQRNHRGMATKRGVGSGYRGSYYGSDGEDDFIADWADDKRRRTKSPRQRAKIVEEIGVARCDDRSPDLPEQ